MARTSGRKGGVALAEAWGTVQAYCTGSPTFCAGKAINDTSFIKSCSYSYLMDAFTVNGLRLFFLETNGV